MALLAKPTAPAATYWYGKEIRLEPKLEDLEMQNINFLIQSTIKKGQIYKLHKRYVLSYMYM